jgi:glycerol 3-phosphatase-2
MVGDRLDTDNEGAHRVQWDSLLVLTGVTGLAELVAAGPEERPTYVAPDLGGLGEAHRVPSLDADGAATLGGWTARVDGGALAVDGAGTPGDWWRVVATAAWTHLDASGEAADPSGVTVPEQERG